MIRDAIAELIREGICRAQKAGELSPFEIPTILVEHPKQADHGDYATNVALQLARAAQMAPPRIAQIIVQHLPPADYIGRVAVAGPGFINITLAPIWIARQVETIRAANMTWGNLDIGRGQKAQVEFVSANPTGPLHIGRTWGAVLGDTIASLLEAAGYEVTREYYFNNAGRQMQILGQSVRARYLELIGRPAEFPEEGYQGDYIWEIARTIVEEQGTAWAEEDWPVFKERAEAWLFDDIRRTLERMGIYFDVWFNEYDLYTSSAIQKTVQALRERGYVYDKDGAVWFKATAFGADKDRVLIKSNGEPTYRLPDIAYHVNKLERGFHRIINVLGADHKDEYPDVIAGVRALGYDADRIQVVIHQFINLVREGKQVRMSTRRANYITLDDLLDEVTITHPESGVTIPGKDPVRFMLLTRSPDSPMNFDLDLVTRQTNENPVYYVQYAHARICSILRKAEEEGWQPDGPDGWETGDVTLLTHPAELTLIRKMLELPEVIESAVEKLAPHQLSFYAMDLASNFHAFYRDCRVLSSDPADAALTRARLKLVDASRITLARVLGLMGMTAPERM
ncbi:MAG: arginine--tRNA ligase [Anaerolineae bacterium]|nr:arginine--tRNA ligase [Anaerolineae bacterium]MDW8098665.1 arginine--tRNA ligase [Anaerolineae bacterium]